MSNEIIYDGITSIREDIVQKAEIYQFKKKESEKSGRKAWMKWGALAACLCLMLVAFSAIKNLTSTQEADTIELGEVLEWSVERVEKKLIGEYRGNILHSWGEPDVVLSETSDKYYLNDDNSEYIILKYDSEGYIQEIVFGNDDVQGEKDNFETDDFDSVVGEPHVWAKEIISIVDHTVVEGIETADAEELFYSDNEYSYVFPSIKSQFVLVTFADGTVKTVVEALEDEEIVIEDLDDYEINYIKKQNNFSETADFGFSYKHIEGTFSYGERVGLSVALTNQMDEDYVWTGSQSNYRARVKLIYNNGGIEYSISPEPIPDTDDMSTHEVKVGEARSFDFYFTIPADAVSGKYSLVCNFEGSTQTFENVFELK